MTRRLPVCHLDYDVHAERQVNLGVVNGHHSLGVATRVRRKATIFL